MKPTKFQQHVQAAVQAGKSLLVVAPTGLGKTFAVAGDLGNSAPNSNKVVYSVPLRSLGRGICESIRDFSGLSAEEVVIHHGDQQDSFLFSEQVVVTTFDQIVCGTPGLPLSFSLKAGHAIAGALMMSRLILDEVHLAWKISAESLQILLGVISFRRRFGLQTILLTGTLPKTVCRILQQKQLFDETVIIDEAFADDERLQLRNANRKVHVAFLELPIERTGSVRQPDIQPLVAELASTPRKVIYFSNTVERLQDVYDKLRASGVTSERLIVLHNRMPKTMRSNAETAVLKEFGPKGNPKQRILLTNQVAEAGLDISAAIVFTDAAPVDTLVQRAGRCARWFDRHPVEGHFRIVKSATTEQTLDFFASPYEKEAVKVAIATCTTDRELSWDVESKWIDAAWIGTRKKTSAGANEEVENAANASELALNLFDRAAQDHSPGQIANAFRDILSIEVAVMTNADSASRRVNDGNVPLTSTISLKHALYLFYQHRISTRILRYRDGDAEIEESDAQLQLGDILMLPRTVAYVHFQKGLCFHGDQLVEETLVDSDLWNDRPRKETTALGQGGRPQSLIEHTMGVMRRTRNRLSIGDSIGYRRALCRIIGELQTTANVNGLADAIVEIAVLAAGLHDLGKGSVAWQKAAKRLISHDESNTLIGRTGTKGRIGVPHTPPAFTAIVKAADLLLRGLGNVEPLVRCVALAAVRHHSSLLNPSQIKTSFEFLPDPQLIPFLGEILKECGGSDVHVAPVLAAAAIVPNPRDVPLMLPNDDLFPIYALVGRAILMSDREDASGSDLERR